jgi:O-antigen/teichoic acid export membrane protein
MLLLDRISIAFIPGLAHLDGEGDRGKFALIARRLLRVTVYAMLPCVGLCMALNKTFVTLWVGPKLYAGRMFDLAMAVAAVAVTFVYTINRVLFAAGVIKGPSIVGAIQNVARAALFILLVWLLGLSATGLSFAIVFTVGGTRYFVEQWTKLLRLQNSEFRNELLRFSKVAVISVLLSYIFGVFVVRNSWVWFVGSGAVFMLAEGALFYMLDAHFRAEVAPVLARITRMFVKTGAEN